MRREVRLRMPSIHVNLRRGHRLSVFPRYTEPSTETRFPSVSRPRGRLMLNSQTKFFICLGLRRKEIP